MHKKISYNSPVILSFTFICLVNLFLNNISRGYFNYKFFSVYKFEYTDLLGYFRLFLHIFGHLNFEHFFSNFLTILITGPLLEEKYGCKNLLIIIFLSSFFTGVVQIIFFNTILLGASGIAFTFIILSSFANLKKGTIPLTTIIVTLIYLGREVYFRFTITDNVSRISHIIGGICGIILGILLNKNGGFYD